MDVPALWDAAWPYTVAVLYTLVVGTLVGWVMLGLRGRKAGDWMTAELGIVERAVCFAASLVGAPEVIAGWLVFKTGSQYKRWSEDAGVFNAFAIGTVLNVSVGVAAGRLPAAIQANDAYLIDGLVVGPLIVMALVAVQRKGPGWFRRLTDPGGAGMQSGGEEVSAEG